MSMKKLMLIVMGLTLLFAACNNCQAPAEEEVATEATGCQMTEEQKAFKADWENWANLTEEQKVALVAKAKENYEAKKAACEAKHAEMTEEQKAECAAKVAAMTEEEQAQKAERDAKKAELEAKMVNWETMTVEEQKVLIDELSTCCKHKCHHGEAAHEGCPHKK